MNTTTHEPAVNSFASSDETDRKRMMGIARNQRCLLLCLLAAILVATLRALDIVELTETGWHLLLAFMNIAFIVFAVGLIWVLFGTAGKIIAIVLLVSPIAASQFFPLLSVVSLLTALAINGHATKVLRGAGLKVGLLGVNPAKVMALTRNR